MTVKKRLFGALLTLCMVISMLPVSAFAASNPYPYWQNINGWGDTVRCTWYAW